MRRIGETLTKDLRKTESADDTLEDFEPECSNDNSEQCGAGFKARLSVRKIVLLKCPSEADNECLKAQKPRTPKSLLGKRKDELRDTDSDTVPDGTEIVKRGEIASSSGSKRVKIYEHLREINDNLDVGLDIVFCGINPGEQSAKIGHHYGNPITTSGAASRVRFDAPPTRPTGGFYTS
ncbi:hypothetical protein BDZ97DRAFT_1914630 [Flammula alnicola]|nr:hypothetical protein BDZ97DRAFT_1914630 [Flammula alnicola]